MAEQWRILVVEGEENLNWNIVNSLQKDGYIVLGVTSGAEAIRTLWSEEYDVVICSQQIPDADGFDLLQWMRTYCPNARMVMLGMPGGGINRTQALEMGVASYLEKPLDLHALKEELRRLLHQTGFSASLDSFDLLDVIQIITMSRKSIALVVNTGLEEQGILRFQLGELSWAEYGTLRGEEAFFALAAHKNGTVVHRPWNDQITPNVTQPLSRLIFQALQYRSKYAEYQQLSSELEAVRPVNILTEQPAPGTQSFSNPFYDLEEDDTPFQFVADDLTGGAQADAQFDQSWRTGATNGRMEQAGGQMTEPDASNGQKKAWWQPTGPHPSFQPSAQMHAITDREQDQAFAGNGSVNITPSNVHKTGLGQSNAPLPAWLTDQPTHLDLPVLRGNTGQMPVTPQERSPVLPKTPPNGVPSSPLPSLAPSAPAGPGQVSDVSAEWPALPRQAADFNPADSGLRKITPEESMFTTPHRVVRPNPQAAPAEWQMPADSPLRSQTGQMGAVQPGFPERRGDTLQSLAALKKAGAPAAASAPQAASPAAPPPRSAPVVAPVAAAPVVPPVVPPPVAPVLPTPSVAPFLDAPDARPASVPARAAQSAPEGKRNYPALAAALQTLGYSLPGFIASAIVGLDGLPIAQVAVDERDIAPLCAYLSSLVQSAARAIEPERGGEPEHIIITSGTRHVLLRVLSKKKDMFQVLITSRETPPAESLSVLASIESALTAAL
ncbi:MAG TPA: response regulator [Ktedonobacteraceae bacterium]